LANIKRELKKAKTLMEVLEVAKQLKLAGEDLLEVNREVSLRRRELAMTTTKATTLKKVIIPSIDGQDMMVSGLCLSIKENKSNKITLGSNGSIEW